MDSRSDFPCRHHLRGMQVKKKDGDYLNHRLVKIARSSRAMTLLSCSYLTTVSCSDLTTVSCSGLTTVSCSGLTRTSALYSYLFTEQIFFRFINIKLIALRKASCNQFYLCSSIFIKNYLTFCVFICKCAEHICK